MGRARLTSLWLGRQHHSGSNMSFETCNNHYKIRNRRAKSSFSQVRSRILADPSPGASRHPLPRERDSEHSTGRPSPLGEGGAKRRVRGQGGSWP